MCEAITTGENALLESPTGTGKTISLLSSAIAAANWCKNKDPDNKYQIIYASRTFTQLNQVMKELKRLPYTLSTTMLGSREKLCINGNVK